MFSQELLTNGELNHFSLKERMVEIGKRWHKLSQSQKDKYKKQVEEQQLEYKAELDAWVKVHAACRFTFCPHASNQKSPFKSVASEVRTSMNVSSLLLPFSVSLSSGARRLQRILFYSECLSSIQSIHYYYLINSRSLTAFVSCSLSPVILDTTAS